jgi:hypothetical protein
MNDDLIILAIYVNLGTQSDVKARTRLGELKAQFEHFFDDTDKNVKVMWFPVLNQPTRVECIYPPTQQAMASFNPYAILETKIT